MKFLLISAFVILSVSFNACGASKSVSEAEYNRANSKSTESLRGLERDTK